MEVTGGKNVSKDPFFYWAKSHGCVSHTHKSDHKQLEVPPSEKRHARHAERDTVL